MLSVTFTLTLSLRSVGSFCNAFWIWVCSVAVSFTPTPVVPPAVPAVAAVPVVPAAPVALVPPVFAPTPAFAPIALEPVLDCVLLLAPLPLVAPVTPPVVLGVLLADCGVLEVEV